MRRLAGGESQSVEQQSPKADRLFDDDTACSDIDPEVLTTTRTIHIMKHSAGLVHDSNSLRF
jgi:hypothetical protein